MDSINNSLTNTGAEMGGSLLKAQEVAKKATAQTEAGQVGNVLQSFGTILQDQLSSINALQAQANEAQQTYAVGGDIELHNVILATEKADLALQLAMQVRNKVVGAYQEITRMNV